MEAATARSRQDHPEDRPLHVLTDSTGLKVYRTSQWLEDMHSARTRQTWRKLHLALDADSGKIIAQCLTDQDTDYPSQVGPLLDRIDAKIDQFTAGGAYDGWRLRDRSRRSLKPIRIRKSKYFNNRIEQDHRRIKHRIRPMLGFKPMASAEIILAGIEMVHMMSKRQARYAYNPTPSLAAQFEILTA